MTADVQGCSADGSTRRARRNSTAVVRARALRPPAFPVSSDDQIPVGAGAETIVSSKCFGAVGDQYGVTGFRHLPQLILRHTLTATISGGTRQLGAQGFLYVGRHQDHDDVAAFEARVAPGDEYMPATAD